MSSCITSVYLQFNFSVTPHTHTHTRLTALFPGLPRSAGTRKAKSIWILLNQETVSGNGNQLDHMQVCTSLQRDNHASTPPLSFLQAGCPSCRPTNSVKALKAVWLWFRSKYLISIVSVRGLKLILSGGLIINKPSFVGK